MLGATVTHFLVTCSVPLDDEVLASPGVRAVRREVVGRMVENIVFVATNTYKRYKV